MEKEQLRSAVIELLFDLHAVNKLDNYVIRSISVHFEIDAFELCDENGITYFIDES